jgi:hypothetical protein
VGYLYRDSVAIAQSPKDSGTHTNVAGKGDRVINSLAKTSKSTSNQTASAVVKTGDAADYINKPS